MVVEVASPSFSLLLVHDRAARDYLLALRQGHFREPRPDVGKWTNLITEIEERVVKAKGDLDAIERVFVTYCRIYPQLADLLSSPAQETRDIGMPALPESARLEPGASAGACRWLERYEAFSKKASPEGYEHYHVFCGLWVLSTITARRVYLPMQRKRIHGNLMIVLYGESSIYAKSETANVALDVLKAASLGYLLAPDKVTPQKLLSDMSGSFISSDYGEKPSAMQEGIRQKLTFAGQRGLFFDELGKFVQGMLRKQSTDAEFERIFLQMDSCPQKFDTSTISRGTETIEMPYLALLGCMTPPNVRKIARRGADFWNDGMWARFSFVAAPPDGSIDKTIEPGELAIPGELIAPLFAWHERLGIPECEITEMMKDDKPTGRFGIYRSDLPEHAATIAKPAYDAYKRYRSALKQLFQSSFDHSDFNASYARLPDTMLRMALLMASLENNNHIELRHVARAQELAELLRQSLHEIYAQANNREASASRAADLEKKIRSLLGNGPLTFNGLHDKRLKGSFSIKEVQDALSALHKAGVVEEFATSHATKYKLIEEPHEDDELR